MKSKFLRPIVLAIIVIILFVSVEIILLLNELNYSGDLLRIVVGRVVSEIVVIGAIVCVVINNNINKIIKPVRQLTKDVRNFRSDSNTYPIRDFEMEEVQELATSFDHMGDELGSTIRKLKHQKEKLETMLGALEEGIVVINKSGYIGQVNELARRMLNLTGDLSVKPKFIHVVRNEEVKRVVEEGLKSGGHQTMEMNLEERIISLSLVPIGDGKEVYEYLLVMRDVTQLRKLEEMRSQFVSNVSHELKTPLTSIQGFVETLQSGALENPKVAYKFLNIIDIEAKRLYRLIQDILSLSEIENMEQRQYGEVHINELIEEVVTIVEREAKKKEIKLSYEFKNEIVINNTGEDHLKQLIMNIISNAIRYTDKGEVKVTVAKNNIIVEDTGIGIPEESIPHIFERFYRVDKGRSRQSGGTGLGLSIVKHIAQLYNIKINVESELGKGSQFKILLPMENLTIE